MIDDLKLVITSLSVIIYCKWAMLFYWNAISRMAKHNRPELYSIENDNAQMMHCGFFSQVQTE